MVTTMAADDDDNEVDGNGTTGDDDGDSMTDDGDNDNDDNDDATGDGATGYNNDDDGDDEDGDDGDGATGDKVDDDGDGTQWRVVGWPSLHNTVEVFTNKKLLYIRQSIHLVIMALFFWC